jgi:hypothetical protein
MWSARRMAGFCRDRLVDAASSAIRCPDSGSPRLIRHAAGSGCFARRSPPGSRRGDIAGSTVVLKLKTADFRLRTRALALTYPTQLAGRLFDAGRELLAREMDGTQFRLIGIGVAGLAVGAIAHSISTIEPSVLQQPSMR